MRLPRTHRLLAATTLAPGGAGTAGAGGHDHHDLHPDRGGAEHLAARLQGRDLNRPAGAGAPGGLPINAPELINLGPRTRPAGSCPPGWERSP
jgi:hypothetical protein